MKDKVIIGFAGIFSFLVFGSTANAGGDPKNIIPRPAKVQTSGGEFIITHRATMRTVPEAMHAAALLNERMQKAAGFALNEDDESKSPAVVFIKDKQRKKESYTLTVTQNDVTISAGESDGFFYGVQTLLQLLPAEIVSDKQISGVAWSVPCVAISDAPKYPWRSFMLDSGRQFQTKEFIKRYLDLLAMLKMNVFHWHLTEGQGWRIEIKRYPKLTEIGSKVAEGEEQQGYYSQDDIREIVDYARQRCITVVPEIDVPGHSEAALIAYPELTCFGAAPQSVMEYSSTLFCGGKESTYMFLQYVLDEVCSLFPGEYIHLGGDEAPKENWDACPNCQAMIRKEGLKNSHELQVHFSSRLANYLKAKGKKAVLWGDVVEQPGPRLPENVVIYWWNFRKKHDAAYQAAMQEGYPIICGTNYYTYLNFPVTPWSRYKEDRTFDMRMAYENNPSDMATPIANVLGMGSCLWTDWHVTQRMIDQRVFPRIFALAEQMWSTGEKRTFEDFYAAVKSQYPWLSILGVQYGPALRSEVAESYSWE